MTTAAPVKFRTRRGVLVVRLRTGDHLAGSYTMRVKRNGRRYYFTLPSTKPEAAKLADEIDKFLDVPTNTIEQAIQRFNPAKWEKMNPETRAATVGDVLDAHERAEKALGLEKRTGKAYRAGLLLLFRQGLQHRRGGRVPSDDAIRAMSLDELTPRLVSDFKLARAATAGDNKSEIEKKKRSANSVFRSVTSLFTEAAREHYPHLTLPKDFGRVLEGMSYRRVEGKKYRLPPTPTIERVMLDAWQLRNGYIDENGRAVPPDRNAYLAWLLAAHAGLRKKEIAHAVIEWVEKTTPPRVWVRSTPDFIAKGKDEGFAEVETWVVEELELLAESPALLLTGNETERGEEVFARLNSWLKARGLAAGKGEKAVHGLRALCGSYWATTRGIFTAQKFLRHKTVDVTNDHYADVILDKNLHRLWKERPAWVPKIAEGVEVFSV